MRVCCLYEMKLVMRQPKQCFRNVRLKIMLLGKGFAQMWAMPISVLFPTRGRKSLPAANAHL